MNKNQEVCVVIRDNKGEVTGIIVSQVHIHCHVMYETKKMGIDEMLTALEPKTIANKICPQEITQEQELNTKKSATNLKEKKDLE